MKTGQAAAGAHEQTKLRSFSVRSRVLVGTTVAILLVGGVGGWSATAELSGAVIAQGVVAVDENVKAVQHRDGGIVSEIFVREGSRVAADDVLLRLDDAQTRAERAIVKTQLAELAIRRARLLAERDLMEQIAFPENAELDAPNVVSIIAGETRLFEGNRSSRESRKQQLELSIRQIGEEILGVQAQRDSKDREIQLIGAELATTRHLADKGLIERARLYTVERDTARLTGEQGEIAASIARAQTRIGEIRLQILSIDEEARTRAQEELSVIETRLSELTERETAIEDRLSRTDIRAPIAGTVNELNIHTIGGVVSPAEVLVTIVPLDATLRVEVKFAPATIDQIDVGDPARLRFTSFNHRTTPEIEGKIAYVSPATSQDGDGAGPYYLGEVELLEGELAKLPSRGLLPGMPVEVYVQTEPRTALSYLAKPITDQFNRALRER